MEPHFSVIFLLVKVLFLCYNIPFLDILYKKKKSVDQRTTNGYCCTTSINSHQNIKMICIHLLSLTNVTFN
jgi:predicted transcriptional regulator